MVAGLPKKVEKVSDCGISEDERERLYRHLTDNLPPGPALQGKHVCVRVASSVLEP